MSPALETGDDRRVRTGAVSLLVCALLSAALIAAYHALQGDVDLNIQDEGFLWYGSLRTAAGELPLRDFRSYDPGRYFWAAAWSFALGKGIVALRLSSAIFAGIGLALGLLAASRAVTRRALLAPLAIVLLAWLFPPWKLYEPAIAMAAVYVAVRLIENPRLTVHVAAGVFTGLAAFFGRNHGLYVAAGLLASSLLVALRAAPEGLPGDPVTRRFRRWLPKLGAWAGGTLLGYSPMLALVAFAPGYARSLVESVTFNLQQKSANLALAPPWPWAVDYAGGFLQRANTFCIGAAFLLLPLFYVPALIVAVRTRAADLGRRAPFLAATFVGAAYAHHAAVRSDLSHLAQCVHPLLLGLWVWPASFGAGRTAIRWIAVGVLLVALTFFCALPSNNLLFKWPFSGLRAGWVQSDVAGDRLWLSRDAARYFETIRAEVGKHVPAQESLFVGPHRPGLYPVLGRVSPTWETYMAWPASRGEQERTIAELAPVDWAFLVDLPLIGRSDLRFQDSHPLVWQYLQREFVPVPDVRLPPRHVLLRRRRA